MSNDDNGGKVCPAEIRKLAKPKGFQTKSRSQETHESCLNLAKRWRLLADESDRPATR